MRSEFRFEKTAKPLKQLLFRSESDVSALEDREVPRNGRPFCIIPAGRPCGAPPKIWRCPPRDGEAIEFQD